MQEAGGTKTRQSSLYRASPPCDPEAVLDTVGLEVADHDQKDLKSQASKYQEDQSKSIWQRRSTAAVLAGSIVGLCVGVALGAGLGSQLSSCRSATGSVTPTTTTGGSTTTTIGGAYETTTDGLLIDYVVPANIDNVAFDCAKYGERYGGFDLDCGFDTEFGQRIDRVTGAPIILVNMAQIRAYKLDDCLRACESLEGCYSVTFNSWLEHTFATDNVSNCWLKNGTVTRDGGKPTDDFLVSASRAEK